MSIQWPLVIFTLLSGMGAGLLVFIGLGEILNIGAKIRKLAAWAAIALLVLGGLASVLHLANPGNFMSALANLGSFSGVSVELILLALGVVIAFIYALVAKEEGSGAGKAVGIAALLIGLVFCWSFGSSYMLAARPVWNTFVLPLAYLGSGLSLGGFMYLTLLAIKKDSAENIKKIALFALVASAIATLAFLIFGVMAGETAMATNGVLFWLGVIVIGGVIPLLAGFIVWKSGDKTIMIFLGLAATLVGGIAFRALMWAVGNTAVYSLFDVAAQHRGLYPF